jgi:hypothetical protein
VRHERSKSKSVSLADGAMTATRVGSVSRISRNTPATSRISNRFGNRITGLPGTEDRSPAKP